MNKIIRTLAATLTISLTFSSTAQARIINSISPPGGAGQGDVLCPQVQTPVDTAFPNSNQNQINNFPGLSCTPKTFQEIAPIDTKLFVEASGGTTGYLLRETVVNSTSSEWGGFNFQIGFQSDAPFGEDNFASPAVISVPRGFIIPTFDSDTTPTSSKFSQVKADGSFNLNWSGGTVAPGESVDFQFAVSVPDDLDNNDFYNSFTIRQLPVASGVNQSQLVPEPSTIFGLLGFLGFGLIRKNNFRC
ncbi:PEP-CTERM putative exosortase interaction domain-containing protein [Rivularia sp. PCC 7116]|uniref:PEP-CTERM sorting domain-containing protein n=1 Tax=Rivularia sp. PCC 7116 TaxID=373994 RepID=UPI00029ED763|nr:PEP-CTERM sorting domain-containing protein [Rivularia sp. PCC 7116]AFY58923.1 PEP-CTERM putative exosortase interaction domain-containing protein [Rivularia sp. PCC 7116]